MKQKVLKIKLGEAYDKDANKNLPVYATAWQSKDGSYTLTQKVFVNEVEVADKQEKVEA